MRSPMFDVLLGTKFLLKEPHNIQVHTVLNTEGKEIVNGIKILHRDPTKRMKLLEWDNIRYYCFVSNFKKLVLSKALWVILFPDYPPEFQLEIRIRLYYREIVSLQQFWKSCLKKQWRYIMKKKERVLTLSRS